MQKEKTDYCHFCDKPFGPLTTRWIVKRARAPKRTPHRWVRIGYACEGCADKRNLNLET